MKRNYYITKALVIVLAPLIIALLLNTLVTQGFFTTFWTKTAAIILTTWYIVLQPLHYRDIKRQMIKKYGDPDTW